MNNKPAFSSSLIQPKTLAGLLVVLSVLAMTACSSTPDRPEWLNNPESAYPAATHLSATGSADDRQRASDRAISNLAKIFEVSVQVHIPAQPERPFRTNVNTDSGPM